MQKPLQASPGSPLRASGLGTLAVLVLLGVGVTAGYMQWKAPEVRAIVEARKGEVALAPSTSEGRLVHWLKYANAMIHNRLQEMRFSAAKPWLVTYASAATSAESKARAASSPVLTGGESPSSGSQSPSSGSQEAESVGPGARVLEIYGIDLTDMPRELGRIQGLTIVVRLPRARSLGRGELAGNNAPFVPIVPASQPLPDANKRSHELAAWALQSLGQALERDIPGAHLSIEIGPEASWSELLEARSKEAAEPPAQLPNRH
jgi:hypothetical protein